MSWYQAFAEQILSRGLDYYQRGLVNKIDIREDFIEASVYGSRVYEVKIKLEDGKITNMKCNCPYAYDGNNCKHMAAVLYGVDDAEPMHKEHSEEIRGSIDGLIIGADVRVVRIFLAINIMYMYNV